MTLTEAFMEWEESRWTAERERIARIGIQAREEALILGAPSLDAAWIGIEAIEAAVSRRVTGR